jgi:hypothetical protein
MNPCGEHILDVVRYLDNELDGQELEDFLAHLADRDIYLQSRDGPYMVTLAGN